MHVYAVHRLALIDAILLGVLAEVLPDPYRSRFIFATAAAGWLAL